MELGDGAAQGFLERVVDRPGLLGQHALLVEAAHLQQVFDDLAGPIHLDPAVLHAGQSTHGAIDVGRGGAVEAQLALQRPAPQLQGGIVQKAEIDRALDLPGRLADQEHAGAGGLDHPIGPLAHPGGHFLLANRLRVLDHAQTSLNTPDFGASASP